MLAAPARELGNAPAIGPRIVPAARRLPWLFAVIVNQVGEA